MKVVETLSADAEPQETIKLPCDQCKTSILPDVILTLISQRSFVVSFWAFVSSFHAALPRRARVM